MKTLKQGLHGTLQASRLLLGRWLNIVMVMSGLFFLWAWFPDQGTLAATASRKEMIEVSPPAAIQQLRTTADSPQVKILAPKSDETLSEPTVTVRLQVNNFKPFKDSALALGPHLNVTVDDLPSQAIYDMNQPITLKDLRPGTHVLRVFANHPWGESYKNPEAYAQVSFNVLTASRENLWETQQPLLTYNQPTGQYHSEPILVDYYLATPKTLAPDSSLLKENLQVQVTVNGQSFKTDRWTPLYLRGFHTGTNWIRLELLDRQGNPLKRPLSETAQVLTLQSQGQDGLSRLVQDQLSPDELKQIVDPGASQKAAKARERASAPVSPPKAAIKAAEPTSMPTPSLLPEGARPRPTVTPATPATPIAPPAKIEKLEPGETTTVTPPQVSIPKKDSKPPTQSLPIWDRFRKALPQTKSSPPLPVNQPIAKPSVEPKPPVMATPAALPTSSPLPEKTTTPSPSVVQSQPIKPIPKTLPKESDVKASQKESFEPVQKAKNFWKQFQKSLPQSSQTTSIKVEDNKPESQKLEAILPKLKVEGSQTPTIEQSRSLEPSISTSPPSKPGKVAENDSNLNDLKEKFLTRFRQAEQQAKQFSESVQESITP